MNVLLSIKPEHVDNIINGSKKFEFRRKIFSKEVSKVVIYCTKPVGRIVAEFSIRRILEDTPDILWERTAEASGINREYFDAYFGDRDKAYAIEIDELTVFETPIEPSSVIENFTAPQSYRYLRDENENRQLELSI